ncbi:MAG: PDR/VanB family oxidoreductase [Demequina sp.]
MTSTTSERTVSEHERPLTPYVGKFYTVAGGVSGSSPAGRAEPDIDLVVDSVEPVADKVVAITLRSPAGAGLPAWAPGAHMDLVLPDGRFTQYSLCGDPDDRHAYRIGVLRSDHADGVSHAVHDLRAGARVQGRGPRNHFALAPAKSYVFVAGGIGITPLLPMLRRAESAGIAWTLAYAGRTQSALAFRDELAQYGDRVTVWTRDERDDRLDVSALVRDAPDDALIYCCGPESLMAAAEAAGQRWAPRRVRTERFAAVPLDRSDDAPIKVRCELSDLSLEVPAGTSILEAANQAGIATVSSCGKGICGTCETVVLDGRPDHRDSVLDEDDKEEGDTMMICVSRAHGPRLVLDL